MEEKFFYGKKLTYIMGWLFSLVHLLVAGLKFYLYNSIETLLLVNSLLGFFMLFLFKNYVIILFKKDWMEIKPAPFGRKIIRNYSEVIGFARARIKKYEALQIQFQEGLPLFFRQDILSSQDWRRLDDVLSRLFPEIDPADMEAR